MTNRVTYAQAAEILGCHLSNVSKLVEKGQLTSTGERGRALDDDQVNDLAQRRAAARAALKARPPVSRRIDHRPGHDHDWLSPKQIADLLGVTKPAVIGRIHRGRLPAVENGGRFWVRRDHLEQIEAARLAQRTRRVG